MDLYLIHAEGNGNPLQCSCLENPRDRGAWWAAIYGVTQSRTRLKWLSITHSVKSDYSFFFEVLEPSVCLNLGFYSNFSYLFHVVLCEPYWSEIYYFFSLSCIGEGNGNPLQCSCLENPGDGGAWWAAVYGVAQSWTRLKRLSSSSSPESILLFMFLNTWN